MRRTLVTGLAAGALLLAGAGTALATTDEQPATGPGTTACQDATAAAEQAHADLDAAVAAALAVDDVDEADLTAAEVTRLELVVEGGGEFVDVANAKLDVIRPALAARDTADAADQAKTTACTPPADDADEQPPAGDEGDDQNAGQGDEGDLAGKPCSTDVIASGITNADGDCVGGAQDTGAGDEQLDEQPTATPGGQVTTIPVGSADTGDGSTLR